MQDTYKVQATIEHNGQTRALPVFYTWGDNQEDASSRAKGEIAAAYVGAVIVEIEITLDSNV